MTARRLAPMLLLALLAAGCGGGDRSAAPGPTSPSSAPATSSPTPGATATASATATPSAAESDLPAGSEPEFRADASPDSSPAQREGSGLTVVDVRVGDHPGYSRVVFELAGTGTVGWRVGYEDDPRTPGAGEPVELAGDGTLVVVLDGVGYPFDTGMKEYSGPRRLAPDLAAVQEVQVGGVFEGSFDAYLGTPDKRPFRVFRLQSPQRVVVDVARGD